MTCVTCGSENISVFFSETIKCTSCDEDNLISFQICNDCGVIWKAVNDMLLKGTVFVDPELSKFISSNIVGNSEFDNWFDVEVNATMEEVVHRCLKCNAIAFESKPDVFCCSVCDFTWETV
jgi:hypothetical protein